MLVRVDGAHDLEKPRREGTSVVFALIFAPRVFLLPLSGWVGPGVSSFIISVLLLFAILSG